MIVFCFVKLPYPYHNLEITLLLSFTSIQADNFGDKFSMELFTFGIDPVLGYLEKRLKGIPIHHLPVEGPVLLPLPPPPSPDPPPSLHGLPALPPPPPPVDHQQHSVHVLPPLVTILTAYCDDLKPAITSYMNSG